MRTIRAGLAPLARGAHAFPSTPLVLGRIFRRLPFSSKKPSDPYG